MNLLPTAAAQLSCLLTLLQLKYKHQFERFWLVFKKERQRARKSCDDYTCNIISFWYSSAQVFLCFWSLLFQIIYDTLLLMACSEAVIIVGGGQSSRNIVFNLTKSFAIWSFDRCERMRSIVQPVSSKRSRLAIVAQTAHWPCSATSASRRELRPEFGDQKLERSRFCLPITLSVDIRQ